MTVEGFTGQIGWGCKVFLAGTAYAGGGVQAQVRKRLSLTVRGAGPPRLPVKGHLLCFALSSLHVHGSVITPAEPPAERQAHAYFVFEVF